MTLFHLNSDFNRGGFRIGRVFKCLNGVDELVPVGDHRFDIDFTGFHQINRARINMRLPENCFNARFFGLRRNDIHRYRFDRHAYENNTTARAQRFKCF